ncbi:alpha/beta fold hydrolase [Phenylobacterium sp. 20VBR1]|uniref:Alpha/beta fold hydrolase n=1 Tax=Phenylobacterium glaciei TaxID=2803784 RepID=A0A941CYD4_9CAUL|nr:alpha/beta fold hydrolase [Phenylobacterium glaciei]MBR7618905.1 alpha/beta fold hydrolase [Phenylobacterium glaciei]
MLRRYGLLALGLILILAGSVLAHAVQTTHGVTVTDVRFAGDKGVVMSGLLYRPASATAATPAPAVLASHGYINTREMQSPFAIELSRRGFVVLAMDMTGHGGSGAAVGQQGFGGPAALRYLRALDYVDAGNIGLEGHSLGGGPVVAAAETYPRSYKAVVLEGSTPAIGAVFGAAAKGSLRNLAVVFGQYDEFAPLMWQVAKGGDVETSKSLQAIFGATGPVVEGRLYGDPAAGTARVLYNPPITHPWEHFSSAGIGHAVDWFQTRLTGAARPLPPGDQIWLWKEVGTGAGFLGFVILLLGTFQVLLGVPVLAGLARPAEPVGTERGAKWWLAAMLTAVVPAATFFAFMEVGNLFFPMKLFPQYITNQLLVWALLNGLLTLGLGLVLKGGKSAFSHDWPRSLAIAVITVAVGHLSLAAVQAVFGVDYRFWVLGLKPLDAPHLVMALAYLPLWTGFFLVSLRALHANLAVKGEGAVRAYLTAALAMSLGFVVLLALQYGSLFSTGLLAVPSASLNTIIAIQFVPLLAMVGVIAAFTYRRTNSYVPGALICAMVICWYVTAGTATHWSPEFRLPGAPATSK